MSSTGVSTIAMQLDRARALHAEGRLAAARDAYRAVLDIDPRHFEALNMLGVISGRTNDLAAAVGYFKRAGEAEPGNSAPHCNCGLALMQLHQQDAALESFDHALALNPNDAVAGYGRGCICRDLGRNDAALAAFDGAIAVNPGFAQAHFARAEVLQRMRRLDGALAGFDQVVALKPDHVEAHLVRGNVLKDLNRLEEALASYDAAIALAPDFAELHSNRGIVLCDLNRLEASLASHDRALELKPGYAEGFVNRAGVERLLGRFAEAAADFARAAALAPDIKFLPGSHLEARLQACSWQGIDAEIARAIAAIERGDAVSHPFSCLALSESPAVQRRAAEIWVRETCRADPILGPIHPRHAGGRIRIGYFSADFREHPVSRLVAGLIEAHDRSRFEVVGFAWGPPSRDEMRQRLERGFDRFIDVQRQSNREVASLARSLPLDIAVDLGGHTHGSRPGLFALRSAPLQVNYLGYPGTSGAPYMDYLIADRMLIPPGSEVHYTEKVMYLPCFQANDPLRRIADRAFTRRELGLPATGVVFCCFNTSYKLSPVTMDSWMRILARVPGSVLLLYAADAAVAGNLRDEARNRGIPPGRLCFAGKLPPAEYLARYRAADLFLDTLPYNAGTVASDALWAGLPVVTRTGAALASRMAASLLQSVGLPELIASSAADYEDLAVALANDPQRRATLRQTLTRRRLDGTLFDARVFTRQLESGFTQILQRHLAQLPPDHVTVPASPG